MRAYVLLLLFIILAFGIASVQYRAASGSPKETEQSMKKQHTNRLTREASPYLRQHTYNPVDWYPWGEEADGNCDRGVGNTPDKAFTAKSTT